MDLRRQRAWLERGAEALALLGFAALVAICVVTMYDGLARYLGLPRVRGLRDFGEVIFAVLIACAFPVGLLRNQNIAVTFLGSALGGRARRGLDLFAAALTLLAFIVLAWAMAERSASLGSRTTRTGLMMVAPWAWAATVVVGLAVVAQLWVVMARIAEARGSEPLVDDHGGATEALPEEGLTGGEERTGRSP